MADPHAVATKCEVYCRGDSGAGIRGASAAVFGRAVAVCADAAVADAGPVFVVDHGGAAVFWPVDGAEPGWRRVRGVNENWLLASFQNKNAIHALMSMVALTFFWRIDYRRFLGLNQRALDGGNPPALSMLLSPATWLLLVTCGMLAAVMVVGREINGARRWLAIGPLGFQPSELAKLALVLFISAYAVHRVARVRSFLFGFVPVVLAFGACTVLVLKADFGTARLWGR